MTRLVLLFSWALALDVQAAPPTSEEVNAFSLLAGARVVDEAGNPTAVAAQLFDGQPCTPYETTVAQNPPLVIELAESFDLTRLEASNSSNEDYTPGVSVKTLRVELGQSPRGPWETQVDWQLQKGSQQQTRSLQLKKTRYLRVTLVANHGNKEWLSLGELSAWGRRSSSRDVLYTGTWETTYGELRLTQTGQRITGCYGQPGSEAGNQLIEGTLRNGALVGLWREKHNGTSDTVGPALFVLTQEGDLSGVWGNTPSDRTQRWDGKKLAKPSITCKVPKPAAGAPPEEVRNGAVRP